MGFPRLDRRMTDAQRAVFVKALADVAFLTSPALEPLGFKCSEVPEKPEPQCPCGECVGSLDRRGLAELRCVFGADVGG